jgi:hypothetical protein
VETVAESLELEVCEIPRSRKIPRRLEYSDVPSASYAAGTPEVHYRKQYYEFLDIVTTGIKVLFHRIIF